jgi:hypothetical protein
MADSTPEPIPVDVSYLQAAQAGVPLYLTREPPRGDGGYGPDIADPDGTVAAAQKG